MEFIFYCACRNDDKSNIALEKILVITLEVLEGSLEAKDCRVVFCPESSVNYNSQLLEILKHVLVVQFEAIPGVFMLGFYTLSLVKNIYFFSTGKNSS